MVTDALLVVKELLNFVRSPVWLTPGFSAKHAGPEGSNFKCLYNCIHNYVARSDIFKTPRSRKNFFVRTRRLMTSISG